MIITQVAQASSAGPHLMAALSPVIILISLLGLVLACVARRKGGNPFLWFGRIPPRGLHSGKAAARWSSTRFPPHLQPIAAYVADLLCEQLGVTLSCIEPTTTFVADLRMDELEPVEVVMALEEDLSISIPDADCTRLNTVTDLVSYLHERLSPNSHNA